MASSSASMPFLVSPAELKTLQDAGDVVVLDVSWYLPVEGRDPVKEYNEKRIPDAQLLDLDEVATIASVEGISLKHMMPDGPTFAEACSKFGISPTTYVVFYDSRGVYSSPRALFMFRSFGHEKSSVLDGGIPRWEVEGFPMETSSPKVPSKTTYPIPSMDASIIRNYDQMFSLASCDLQAIPEVVLDARPKGRFDGVDPEPRPIIPSGHMPNSTSLPFSLFLSTNDVPPSFSSIPAPTYTTVLPPAEIRAALESAVGPDVAAAVVRKERPVVVTCGSGMTAGTVWLGLQLLGIDKMGFYDESWTGYVIHQGKHIKA
ncbi:Rhodanese-like protein [Coniophora puteana RWD-64-598 SS2]|uniref:Rhodanese-like protein n=1 Tax=Coniophora puteana (strain RWD-64-598) TaxID=741705 RepID=A0A5M3MXR8_CONPW|nr:Rhodanese-like protein [Coniophora puteana RWD-64-598 SS2]EIW83574.1 Rhodanese-like protein [Coniophora puteana RWD-64-598 SS2]